MKISLLAIFIALSVNTACLQQSQDDPSEVKASLDGPIKSLSNSAKDVLSAHDMVAALLRKFGGAQVRIDDLSRLDLPPAETIEVAKFAKDIHKLMGKNIEIRHLGFFGRKIQFMPTSETIILNADWVRGKNSTVIKQAMQNGAASIQAIEEMADKDFLKSFYQALRINYSGMKHLAGESVQLGKLSRQYFDLMPAFLKVKWNKAQYFHFSEYVTNSGRELMLRDMRISGRQLEDAITSLAQTKQRLSFSRSTVRVPKFIANIEGLSDSQARALADLDHRLANIPPDHLKIFGQRGSQVFGFLSDTFSLLFSGPQTNARVKEISGPGKTAPYSFEVFRPALVFAE